MQDNILPKLVYLYDPKGKRDMRNPEVREKTKNFCT
jgi:hypothetical protein